MDEVSDYPMMNVTPPPVSRLQFEKETAEHAMRVEPPPTCQICETLLSCCLDPLCDCVRMRLDEHDKVFSLERRNKDGYLP